MAHAGAALRIEMWGAAFLLSKCFAHIPQYLNSIPGNLGTVPTHVPPPLCPANTRVLRTLGVRSVLIWYLIKLGTICLWVRRWRWWQSMHRGDVRAQGARRANFRVFPLSQALVHPSKVSSIGLCMFQGTGTEATKHAVQHPKLLLIPRLPLTRVRNEIMNNN